MAHNIRFDDLGLFGLGEGQVEMLLTDEEFARFMELIDECHVPVSIFEPITCGDEREGLGTMASEALTKPRPKLFGALMGIYGGLLLADPAFGMDPVSEMRQINRILSNHGYRLGGHTDSQHKGLISKYFTELKNGKSPAPLEKSACGMADNCNGCIHKVALYGDRPEFARLDAAIMGDAYDEEASKRTIASAKNRIATAKGGFATWRGGYLIDALADNPDHIEVLNNDGVGFHGHRGALIEVNNREGYTLDRYMLAQRVAEDPLLAKKRPNAFCIDNWTIPYLAEPLAEFLSTATSQVDSHRRTLTSAIRQVQLGTGITLVKGTQHVIAAS